MDQMSTVGIMKAMVPITRFNKGEASKIFEEVENSGTKIVVKNNKPACVLMSPAQYEAMLDILSDHILLEEAVERMKAKDDKENVSLHDVMRDLGISEEDLSGVDVEII